MHACVSTVCALVCRFGLTAGSADIVVCSDNSALRAASAVEVQVSLASVSVRDLAQTVVLSEVVLDASDFAAAADFDTDATQFDVTAVGRLHLSAESDVAWVFPFVSFSDGAVSFVDSTSSGNPANVTSLRKDVVVVVAASLDDGIGATQVVVPVGGVSATSKDVVVVSWSPCSTNALATPTVRGSPWLSVVLPPAIAASADVDNGVIYSATDPLSSLDVVATVAVVSVLLEFEDGSERAMELDARTVFESTSSALNITGNKISALAATTEVADVTVSFGEYVGRSFVALAVVVWLNECNWLVNVENVRLPRLDGQAARQSSAAGAPSTAQPVAHSSWNHCCYLPYVFIACDALRVDCCAANQSIHRRYTDLTATVQVVIAEMVELEATTSAFPACSSRGCQGKSTIFRPYAADAPFQRLQVQATATDSLGTNFSVPLDDDTTITFSDVTVLAGVADGACDDSITAGPCSVTDGSLEDGVVTGVSGGSATLGVAWFGYESSVDIVVNDAATSVTSISIESHEDNDSVDALLGAEEVTIVTTTFADLTRFESVVSDGSNGPSSWLSIDQCVRANSHGVVLGACGVQTTTSHRD